MVIGGNQCFYSRFVLLGNGSWYHLPSTTLLVKPSGSYPQVANIHQVLATLQARPDDSHTGAHLTHEKGILLFYYYSFWWGAQRRGCGVSLCHLGWSAVVGSQLTANSTSWVQVILLPQPPR